MQIAIGLAFLAVPAAIWRVRVIGLAEIERRIAHWLLPDARCRDAAAACRKRDKQEVEGLR